MKVGSLLKGWFALGVLGFVFFVFWLVGRLTSREMVSDPNDWMVFWFGVWFGWLFTWVWVLGVLCLVWCLVWLNRRRDGK